jgi:hypothetical protein
MDFPKQADKMNGWELDYGFLKEVKAEIRSKTNEKISLEAVEDVLIAAEKVTKKRSLT